MVPVKVVVLFGKWSHKDEMDFHVLITNNSGSQRELSC